MNVQLDFSGEGSSNRNASRDESVETGDESVETKDESIEAGENATIMLWYMNNCTYLEISTYLYIPLS